jgi:hypothetical protein
MTLKDLGTSCPSTVSGSSIRRNGTEPGLSIKKGENFVHARVSGPVSLELVAELMKKSAEKAKKWGFNKYLVDFRQAEKQLSVFEHYDFAYKKAKEYGFKPGSKHALIVRHEDINRLRFVEMVYHNAGYILKIFTEEDGAIDWIGN